MPNSSFDNVQWGATLWLNFLRSVAAGIVWFGIRLLIQSDFQEAVSMLLLPIVYFAVLLPVGLFANFLSSAGVPFMWFVNLVAAFAIIAGDPILFLISLIKPDFLPVKSYMPLNFNLFLLVKN